jgi:iron complex outermembrane receptor protein
MRVFTRVSVSRSIALCAGVSFAAITLATTPVDAQGVDIGSVNVRTTKAKAKAKPRVASAGRANGRVANRVAARPAPLPAAPVAAPVGAPIQSDAAVGTNAPVGSAPALAPSQQSLNAFEPGSIVSDKVIKDITPPGADYNDILKFTPGFYSTDANGLIGDTNKGGWRGFADGQYNITYDGIPFQDANDPSHHSAANFPTAFIGKAILDRGPGAASQVGYATFGGTLSLLSQELKNTFGGEVGGSVGSFGTFTGFATLQSGLVNGDTRAMAQYYYGRTDGAIRLGHVDQNAFLLKVDKQMGDVKATLFSTVEFENYNNIGSPTGAQIWGGTNAKGGYVIPPMGITYGQLNNNPATAQYVGYNNSQKRTDLEYIKLEGDGPFGFKLDNSAYTYSYWYPNLQNNGNDQTIEGPASVANGGTIQTVSITNPPSGCVNPATTCKTTITYNVANGDVTGYKKNNNYRDFGDIFNATRKFDAGVASGILRAGVWVEHVDNHRLQQYFDYTTGQSYANTTITTVAAGGATPGQVAIDMANASYKLNLDSHITNVQPYVEYEWKPIEQLSITPGYKYESFTRDHFGQANQTTIQPVNFSKTYTAHLPFFSVRYRLTPEMTVYAQASKGYLAPAVAAFYVYDLADNSISPEQTVNLQTGVAYKSALFNASADIYQITASNFPITTTLADGTVQYTNGGTARYQGVEGETTFAFGKLVGGFADGFAAYASGALSNAKFIEGPSAGLAVPNAPRWTFANGLVYDNGQIFGSLLTKFTGEQYGSKGQQLAAAAVNPALNHIPSYNTTDFAFGVRSDFLRRWLGWGQKAEFRVGVSNIFDHHSVVDIGGTPTLTNAALTYSFLAGRIVYAGAKVTF